MKDVLNKDNVKIGSIVTFKNGGKGKIVWFDKTDMSSESWYVSIKFGFIDGQSEDTGYHIFNKYNGRLLTNCAQASMLDIMEVTPPEFNWDDVQVGYCFQRGFGYHKYIFVGNLVRAPREKPLVFKIKGTCDYIVKPIDSAKTMFRRFPEGDEIDG